ncbi:MAG: DNA polymerase III subunit delta' C-terminal domain-containing protein [Verrucomicrobiales bacterium]
MSFHYDKAVELIEQARENARLAHAYLLTGPPGSGKERLAIHMVDMGNPRAALARPGTLEELRSSTTAVVGPESKSRRISVKAIRDIEHTLQMAAPAGVTKFAVIKDADRMGPQAENAFLKTLEEPPAASRLILVTSRPEMLLDTILSRCIRISLTGTGGPAELTEGARGFLEALSKHTLKGGKGISGALGLMAKFAAILKDEKSEIAKRNEEAQKIEAAHYRQTTEGDYLKRREEYFKALTEAEYLERRNRLIEFLVMWFGDAMRLQSGATHLDLPDFSEGTNQMARELSLDELGRRIDAIETLRSNLNTNVFEALALEVGFIRAFG